MHRRRFVSAAAGFAAFQTDSALRAQSAASAVSGRPADTVAQDEDFWFNVRHAFTVDRNIINLNTAASRRRPRRSWKPKSAISKSRT
jgi:hypothetical protein